MTNLANSSKEARVAKAMVRKITMIGMTRKQAKESGQNVVTSLGTARNYKAWVKGYLTWLVENRLPLDGNFSKEQMQEYLCDMADQQFKQQYLDSVRQALQKTFSVVLERVESETPTILTSRAYTAEEVDAITNCQSARNAFSTRLSLAAGLRAHELLTLHRSTELNPSDHRPWSDSRFAHFEEFVRFTVIGKGGLKRHVAIPIELAVELEILRRPHPKIVVDRDIPYTSLYDVSGGQAFSQSVSAASKKVFGRSNGAHGFRHAYAQKRLVCLKKNGFSTSTAMLILSQELGHFRPEICLAYLR